MVQCVLLTFGLRSQLCRMTLPCLAAPCTTWEGRWGNPRPSSDRDGSAASSLHTCRSEGFFPSPRTPITIMTVSCSKGLFFFACLFLSQAKRNALFHRVAQEATVLAQAVSSRPWAGRTRSAGGRTAGWMPSTQPQGNTEAPCTLLGTSLHQNLPFIYSL